MSFWPWCIGVVAMFGWSGCLLAWGWRKWPDLLVDFGRELYIPWQLSEGKVLYQDIYSYYGPLTKYFHAFLFKVFSPSFDLLLVTNFVLLGILAWLIYRTLRVFASVRAAWLALALFFALFAFGHHTPTGNYNYLCPYSHELVHGLMFSLAAFLVFMRYCQKPSLLMIMLAGFFCGLVFLEKVEVFVALAATALAAGAVLLWNNRGRIYFSHLTAFGLAFLAPVLLFLGYFSLAMGFDQALTAILLPYKAVFSSKVQVNMLYQRMSGLGDLRSSLLLMGRNLGGYAGVLVVMALAAKLCYKRHWTWRIPALLVAGGGILYFVFWNVPPFELLRPLPVIILAIAAALGWRMAQAVATKKNWRPLYGAFILAVFAVALLLKMCLYGQIQHYGFVLAVPAVLMAIVLFCDDGISYAAGRGFDRKVLEALFVIVLAGLVVSYGQLSRYYYSYKDLAIGKGADSLVTYGTAASLQGVGLAATLDHLRLTPKNSTVVVFPEGVMLNYLSRRANPTPFFEFPPGFFYMVPQEKVLEAFRKTPPDYVVMVDRNMSEYGPRFFGRDYAQGFWAWIKENYRSVRRIGDVPFSETKPWVWIGQKIN